MKSANVLPADYKRPAPIPPPAAPDLNLDPTYEGAEGFMGRPIYEGEMMTPTADMLFSPVRIFGNVFGVIASNSRNIITR